MAGHRPQRMPAGIRDLVAKVTKLLQVWDLIWINKRPSPAGGRY
jgi:hypothetical protein